MKVVKDYFSYVSFEIQCSKVFPLLPFTQRFFLQVLLLLVPVTSGHGGFPECCLAAEAPALTADFSVKFFFPGSVMGVMVFPLFHVT